MKRFVCNECEKRDGLGECKLILPKCGKDESFIVAEHCPFEQINGVMGPKWRRY